MRFLLKLTLLSLVNLTFASPTSSNDGNTLTITKNIFSNHTIIYSGNHEIVYLLVPLNGLNYVDDYLKYKKFKQNSLVFFVEADTDSNGDYVEQGIYVIKDGKATKLLEHGRDIAASRDLSKLVFFGTKDGIYVYDHELNSAAKYGAVDDSIIGIVVEKTGDVIYILTEDRELFKVTNGGTKKEKINYVVNARQVEMDLSNNIYFYSDDKQVYVRTVDGVKKIEGLPNNPGSVNLLKPTIFIFEFEAVPFVVDNSLYIIYANGTSRYCGVDFEPQLKPSAYAPDAIFVQYYAYNKELYQSSSAKSAKFNKKLWKICSFYVAI